MKGAFASIHARALCHATEVLDRVKLAVQNVVGDAEPETARTKGHHGNEMTVIEVHSTDLGKAEEFLRKFSVEDRTAILSTLDRRIDESCNLFVRVDKQAAFSGRVILADSEDVVAVRVKVNAFPAKREVAAQRVAEFLGGSES